MFPAEAVFSVSEYLDLLNGLLQPVKVTVRGEVTQVQERGSAVYFTLADGKEKATLSGLIWRDKLWKSGVTLEVGSEYACVGAGNVYKPTGRLSFMADTISPLGEGALQAAFEKLKLQLDKEGYFGMGRKRPLPPYVENIILLTSSQGDAQRDFRTHLGLFGQQVELIDIRVEGVRAVDSIVQAFAEINARPSSAQVIVLTRGGGSLESLQAFNSREVAEAIFASKIPVVSAVGHEKDVTIADLVADVRASTPTDAGKLLARDWSLAAEVLHQTQQAIVWRLESRVRECRQMVASHSKNWLQKFEFSLQRTRQRLQFSATQGQPVFQRFTQKVDAATQQFHQNISTWKEQWRDRQVQIEAWAQSLDQHFLLVLQRAQQNLQKYDQLFEAVSPRRRLAQGYVWMTDQTGKVVRLTDQVQVGESVLVTMLDGTLKTNVLEVQKTTLKE